jgi:adenine phosphoribosyltransferase
MDALRTRIRNIRDFPKKGIVFRDITTLLKDHEAFASAVDGIVAHYNNRGIQKVVGIESRGFILGGVIARELHAGFVPVRKPGKLPAEVVRKEYALEYGTDAIEMHRDAITPGERVLLHDDLLATGGTARAAIGLVEDVGGVVIGASFLVELSFLDGRSALQGREVFSLIQYESE